MRTVVQTDLLRFLLGILDGPVISQDTPDHPEGSDANGGRTVNESRPVLWIVGQLEKLCRLLIPGIVESDGNIEVTQPELLCDSLFLGSRIFGRMPEVD